MVPARYGREPVQGRFEMRSRTCQVSEVELHDPQHPIRHWLSGGVGHAGGKRLALASYCERGAQIATPSIAAAMHVEDAELIIGIIELFSELESPRQPTVHFFGCPCRKSKRYPERRLQHHFAARSLILGSKKGESLARPVVAFGQQ